jgi:hypothetical protein
MGGFWGTTSWRPPFRVVSVEAPTALTLKTFVSNQKWTCVDGHEFFVGDEVKFPERDVMETWPGCPGRDGSYRTCWRGVQHNGLLLANTNLNMQLAMRRVTACRGDSLFLEGLYRANQAHFIMTHAPEIDYIKQRYSRDEEHEINYVSMAQAAIDHHGDPHPKRLLRIAAMLDLYNAEKGLSTSDMVWLRKGLYKLKRDEWAKVNKYGRVIADLGVIASLQGFIIFKYLKMVMEMNPLVINGLLMIFVASPSTAALTRVFNLLFSLDRTAAECFTEDPFTNVLVYFSDDGGLAYRHNYLGLQRFENDISSCDGSHTSAIFRVIEHIAPYQIRDDLAKTHGQLLVPMEIRDVNIQKGEQKRRVKLVADSEVLFSGFTGTTPTNNTAQILCGIAISEIVDSPLDNIVDLTKKLVYACARVGYLMKFEHRPMFEEFTFLKHNPVLHDGTWVPFLNLGVLLRTYGTCHGDLPAKVNGVRATMRERALSHDGSVLNGMYPQYTCRLIENMRKHSARASRESTAKLARENAYSSWYSRDDVVSTPILLSDVSVYKRYGFTVGQAERLNNRAGNLDFEQVSTGPEEDIILKTDYGLTCTRGSWYE